MHCISNRRISSRLVVLGLLLLLLTASSALAATGVPTVESRLAELEAKVNAAPGIANGDNAWVLISSALVLMMSAPGLVSVLWVLFGYSMAFGEGNAFCGNPFQHFLLRGVGAVPNPDYGATVPEESFMLFQMMFAIITPALISGAVAERMKFSAWLLFTMLWVTLVYFPLAHMVWGKGGMFNWALGGKIPVLDFAGGTVVHISSGVSALVCALVLGKRLGYPREPMPPHNVVLSLIGVGLLWVGWFGFNAGSAVNAGKLATSAFAATHFSASAAALSRS